MRKRIRKTRFQQLHLIITIIAAILTTGICLFTGAGLYSMAVLVSSVIIVFYAIGQVLRLYLEYVLKPGGVISEEVLDDQDMSANANDDDLDDAYLNTYAEFDEARR